MNTDPFRAHRHCSQAWLDYGQGRTSQALSEFRLALSADPASMSARFGLSSVLLDFGDIAGASNAVDAIGGADALRPEIRWLRARIAVAQGTMSEARSIIEALLAEPALDAPRRAEALLLLGLVLDDLEQAEAAFSAAREGKRLLRALHAAQASGREGEVAKLRRIADWIARAPAAPERPLRPPPRGDDAGEHVFLIGFPRSGTTLLEQVLAAHPGVATLEEAPTLAAAYQAFLVDDDACASLAKLDDDEAQAWSAHYWETVRTFGVDARGRLFVDKQPAGTLLLPIIERLFPDARILFAIRDPRDVVLSCFRQAFQMNAMTYAFTDLVETAACYDACMTLAEQARTRTSLRWMDVRHEALVEDFEGALKPLLAFVGLGDEPAIRNFARLAGQRPIRTPSAPQVRAGINRRGLDRWRHYQRDLAPILPLLAPWAKRFGYPPRTF